MIEGLKPYADYKESGQEWLGRVPGHGDVRRTKLILREVDSRSTGKEQLLRVSHYRTRLTADLLTGKLGVREAAGHLPRPASHCPRRTRPPTSRWKKSKPRMTRLKKSDARRHKFS
jgi:hypothetical protein